MRKTAFIFAALLCIVMLASCGGGKGGVVYEHPSVPAPKDGQSWTVLVYLIGGENETKNSSASKKLQDIMSVDCPANIHVITETGGSAEWHTKGVYSDYLQRFESVDGGRMYLADQMQTASMGDHRTLTEFIMWGTSRYRADNYMLIISGTGGGGMYGIGSDELFEYDCLELDEIAYALSTAGTKFDVVGMDASLMGSLETATAIGNYADYLAAPQDMQDIDCWDYADIISFICDNNNADGGEVAKKICDSCFEADKAEKRDAFSAMSVIDTSKITMLNQAFDGMAGEMLIATDSLDNYKNLASAIGKVHVYGGGCEDEGWSDMIDLGDMAAKCSEYVGAASARLLDVLSDTIVYKVCGSEQTGATGLSVYYPLSHNSDRLQEYMDMSHGSKYKELLRKTCIDCDVTDSTTNTSDYRSSWAWDTYNNDMAWLEYQTFADSTSYELQISGNMDLFRDVKLNVYKYDKKSGYYVYMGKYNDISGDWGSGYFNASFYCRMPELFNKPVTMSLIRSYDDYDLYSIPALVNGEVSSIRVKYQDARYTILGYWGALDGNGQALGAMRELKAFDRITPMLAVYNEHGERNYVLAASARRLWRDVKVRKVGDGDYITEFVMTDVYGLERYGTPVNATVSGRRVTYR